MKPLGIGIELDGAPMGAACDSPNDDPAARADDECGKITSGGSVLADSRPFLLCADAGIRPG